MRGFKGKDFLTETLKEAVRHAGLADKDSRMEGASESSRRAEAQEPGWTRVESGARPAPRMEGQRSNWADVASNRFYSLSN